jgi:hypothetical protein
VKVYRAQAVDGLARVLVVLLGVAGFANLLTSIISFAFWQDAVLVLPLSRGTFTSFPAPQGPVPTLIGTVSSLAGLGAMITWLIWQHHVTANLWARRLPGLKTSPGWAVGWWFIPFANLVMPYLVMREVDRRSSEVGAVRSDRWVVGWWWVAYLLSTLGLGVAYVSVFFAQGQRFFEAIEADRPSIDLTIAMRQAASWGVVGGVATAVAAALAILVVQRITRNQAGVIRGPLPPRPDIELPRIPARPG